MWAMPTTVKLLTERERDLAVVALDSAAQACQSGASLRNQRGLDPLAREYLLVAQAIERMPVRDE